MRVRKWPLWERNLCVCWNITRVSLWLLCKVHFVQSKQRTRLQKPFVRDINNLLKVGVCASRNQVYGPLFFAKETVTGMTYLDMLQLWLMSQLQNIPAFIFQQDRSPVHFLCEVHQYLNTGLPGRWIGHLEMTNHWCYGPQGPLTSHPVIVFFGDMSKTGYSSHHCHVTLLT